MTPVLIWFFVGLALIILEFVVPGVVLVFFGLAAWIVTLLAWSGLVESTALQLLVFIVASLALLFGCRRFVKRWFVGDSTAPEPEGLEEFVGKHVRVVHAIPGGADTGKVELKGAEWSARSETPIARGDLAVVVARDGLQLVVRPH